MIVKTCKTPWTNITVVEVTAFQLVIHMVRPASRVMIGLSHDPDRHDNTFKLPVEIAADVITYDEPYLRFFYEGAQIAEFTLKDVTL